MGERVSEIVQCDGCGELAKRRVNRPCPDRWFFIPSVDRTQPKSSQRIYIVWACSERCRDGLWQKGPGDELIDETGTKDFREREADHG